MTKRLRQFSLVALALVLTATPAVADGLYVGGGGGRTSFKVDLEGIWGQPRSIDDSAKGWKAFGGVSESFFAVEGGYRDFGSASTTIAGVNVESGTTAWDAAAMGRVRVPIVDMFVKAGVMWWSRDTSIGSIKDNTTGTDFFWGAGVGVHLGPFGARVEWEWVQLDSPDKLSMVSVSGTLGF